MVEVQLAKFKEETRCPMCFGELFPGRGDTQNTAWDTQQ
jgi:hypothetical protein